MRFFIAIALMVMGLVACNNDDQSVSGNKPAEFKATPAINPFQGVGKKQVERVLEAMTLEEKIGQLVIWAPHHFNESTHKEAIENIKSGRLGGINLPRMQIREFLFLTDEFRRNAPIPLLLGTDQKISLHEQFKDMPSFPKPFTISAIDSFELQTFLEDELLKQCQAVGINLAANLNIPATSHNEIAFNPDHYEHDPDAHMNRSKRMVDKLKNSRILSIASDFSAVHIEPNDSLRAAHLHALQGFMNNGVQGIILDNSIFEEVYLQTNYNGFLTSYLSYKLDFQGLTIAELLKGETPELKLLLGVDLLVTPDIDKVHETANLLIQKGKISEREIDNRVRKILTAKSWVNGGKLPVEFSVFPRDSSKQIVRFASFSTKQSPRLVKQPLLKEADFKTKAESIASYFEDPVWDYFSKTLYERSTTLASDVNKLVPFQNIIEKDFKLFEFGNSNFSTFKYYFSKYADFQTQHLSRTAEGNLPLVQIENPGHEPVAIILLDSFSIDELKDKFFIESINDMSSSVEVVLVNFGTPLNLDFFEKNITFLQVYERNKWTESYAAQALFGGQSVNGKLPIIVNEHLPFGASEFIAKSRLGFGGPENVGVAPERLVSIDAIAKSAIQNGVFPGCQVAIAKQGEIIYSKAFGYHTYGKKKAVKTTDLYDIASISKVAATTMAIMKLYENHQLSISNKVGDYSEFEDNSAVSKIKIKDLLTHQSGLQAPMPIGKFFNYRSVPLKGCNDIFCHEEDDSFNIQIADELFFRGDFRDTIWKRVSNLSVSSYKRFRYSDVNFYLLQKAAEDISQSNLDELLYAQFYEPLGLRRFMFNPTNQYDLQAIVPTEKDRMWRKTLVHGFVHDPSAALMGGVGGNAGLFSNAEDMATLFQMLVADGKYGGAQYLEPTTIQTFTSSKPGSHRGLGFDKPIDRKYPTYSDQSPSSAFGHTGFTGTCVWADPENDLIYVFLSNRIHPTTRNKKIFTEGVRQRIHEVAYDAFDTFDPQLPTLNSKK